MFLGLPGLGLAGNYLLGGTVGAGSSDGLDWAGDAWGAWDFINNQSRYAGANRGVLANTPNWTFTRASTGYAQNAAGLLIPFASGELRRTDKGALIEGARTNLLLRSQEFDNASWTKTRSSVTADAVAAPDGTTTADKLVEDNTAGNSHTLLGVVSGNLTNTYTASVYAKAGERTEIQLGLLNNAEAIGINQYFNLGTGAVGASVDAGSPTSRLTPTIEALGNGWYRCSVGGVLNSGGGAENVKVCISLASSGTTSYNGDNASGAYIWGAQLEAGAGASSYIPTTTASVTRAADSLTITGVSGLAYPLSLYCEFGPAFLAAAAGVMLQADDGAINERAFLNLTSGAATQCQQIVGGAGQAAPSVAGAVAVGSTYRAAARFGLNSVQMARGGTLATEDTSASVPATPTRITIGMSSTWANCWIRRAAVFNRALGNSELQAVST